MIRHIFNNIKSLLKKEKMFILMLVIIQLFSVLIIFSAYGIVNHYNTKIGEVEGGSLKFEIYPPTNREDPYSEPKYEYEDVEAFFNEVLPKLNRKISYFGIFGNTIEKKPGDPPDMIHPVVEASSGYRNGEYTRSKYFEKLFDQYSMEGFNAKDYNSGEKNVYITLAMKEYLLSTEGQADTLMMGSEEYKVIGVLPSNSLCQVFVTYKSFPRDIRSLMVKILLKSPLTRTEYEFLKESVMRHIGEAGLIPEFDGIENESDYRVYRNMIFIIIGMVIICGINYCLIYHYLIYRNRTAFAVCRICGCTRGRAAIGYISELLAESAVTFAAGVALFYKAVLEKLGMYFEYAELYYSRRMNLYIFAIYMGVLLIIYSVQIINYVHKTPSELIKEV